LKNYPRKYNLIKYFKELAKKISTQNLNIFLPEFVNNNPKMSTNSSGLGAIFKKVFIGKVKIASAKFLILKIF